MGLLYLYFCIDLSVTHTSCISFTPLDCDSVDVTPVWPGLLISECFFDHNCDSDCDFDWLRLCPSLWLNVSVVEWINVTVTDWLTESDCNLLRLDGKSMTKCACDSDWLTDWLWLCLNRAVMVCCICGSEWLFLRVTDWLTDSLWLCWSDSDWLWQWIWDAVPASVSYKVNLPVVIICIYLHKHFY